MAIRWRRHTYAPPAENFKTRGGLTTNAVRWLHRHVGQPLRDLAPTSSRRLSTCPGRPFRLQRHLEQGQPIDPDEFGQIDITK